MFFRMRPRFFAGRRAWVGGRSCETRLPSGASDPSTGGGDRALNLPVCLAAEPTPALPETLQLVDLWLGFGLGLASAVAVIGGLWAAWRAGPGRLFVLQRKLRQVVAGGQLTHVESQFGPALFVQQTDSFVQTGNVLMPAMKIHSWVSPEHVLRCWEVDGVVRGWLVTSRTPRFKPEWHIGSLHIRLHDTPLACVGTGFDEDTAMYGANWFGYAETAGGGRPTYYQTVMVGISEEGLHNSYGELFEAMAAPQGERRDRVGPLRSGMAFDTVSVHDDDIPANNPLSLMLYSADLQRVQPDVGPFRRWRYRHEWRRRQAEFVLPPKESGQE